MELLLTVLSGLLLLLFLAVLAVALHRVLAALEGIQRSANRIAWGVRAIEQETSPLREQVAQLDAGFAGLVAGGGAIAGRLESADAHLGRVAEILTTEKGA
jgi:hypothetical protein